MVLMPITIAVGVEQLHKNWAIATLQYRSEESHAAAFSKTYSLKMAAQSVSVHMDISRSLATRFHSFSGRNPRSRPASSRCAPHPSVLSILLRDGHKKQLAALAALANLAASFVRWASRAFCQWKCLATHYDHGNTLAAPVGNPSRNKTKGMCTAVKDSLESFLAG